MVITAAKSQAAMKNCVGRTFHKAGPGIKLINSKNHKHTSIRFGTRPIYRVHPR